MDTNDEKTNNEKKEIIGNKKMRFIVDDSCDDYDFCRDAAIEQIHYFPQPSRLDRTNSHSPDVREQIKIPTSKAITTVSKIFPE